MKLDFPIFYFYKIFFKDLSAINLFFGCLEGIFLFSLFLKIIYLGKSYRLTVTFPQYVEIIILSSYDNITSLQSVS